MDLRPPQPPSLPPHLVFATQDRWYALPAECAAEVLSFGLLTSVPAAPPHLLGVFAHRGEVVPVVDLSLLVHGEICNSQRAILMRVAGGVVALIVEEVVGVGEVEGTPVPLGRGVQAHLHGPARVGPREVTLLDPQGLFGFLSDHSAAPTPPHARSS